MLKAALGEKESALEETNERLQSVTAEHDRTSEELEALRKLNQRQSVAIYELEAQNKKTAGDMEALRRASVLGGVIWVVRG